MTRMPTVGQLLLIVVALAAPADMTITFLVRGIVGRPQLAKNNDCGNRRCYQCSFVQHQPPCRPTAQQRSFVAMEEHTIVANFEPGPCHRTLEVGTGLNHSKVGLYTLVIKSGMTDDILADRLLAVLQDT